ncbi:PriCT-2 domain-containing protein [Methylomicrobium sp. Wu6]|uniref:PriCT-2 domain-containing protein n=1 Tax=Methylomicrobium sp. Wu6 TaxID=3107928 RepID=UPI002DD6BA7C|nr:PriCT-2 domain-containing protein [Methylomicrobium sp. Wu6]MEC4747458.1 PriCT-2 domain-containing protein [Methylomicrobium sp. Wu6]
MQSQLIFDKALAEKHLSLLDETAEQFLFCAFDDQKERKNPALTYMLFSSLDTALPQLEKLNRQGAGIFVCVNQTHGKKRKTDDINRLRALWIEADRPGAKLPQLDPHFIIESSPGKRHYYFLLDDAPLKIGIWETVQQRLVDDHGSDPNAKDRSRVLRLAGSYHMKNPEQPHLVRIVQESGGLPYSWQTVVRVLPPVQRQDPKPILEPVDRQKLPDIKAALRYLDPDCDYQDWLNIGMAIHHACKGGQAGFDAWDQWSAGGLLYKCGETAYRWNTFHTQGNANGQVTANTLFKKAQQGGWNNQITPQDAGLPGSFHLVNVDKLPVSETCKMHIRDGGESRPLLNELMNSKVSEANILSILLDQRNAIAVNALEDAEQLLQSAKTERDKPIADAIALFAAWDKKDLGFPFEPEALDALQLLKEHAISDYERIKGEMRQAKVSLRELDKAVNAHRQNKTLNAIADGTHPRQSPQKLDAWPYTIENQAITWNKTTESGTIVPVELCNFTATIQRQIIHDDGAEERGAFDIAGKLRGGKHLPTINVPLVKFGGMTWITANWGNEPIVYAGQTVKDHLRCAIQKLSGNVERVTVYGHIGWKKIEGQWRYLHHGGALGADDNLDSISVDVDGGGAMHLYRFPLSGINAIAAIQASLKLLNAVPDIPEIGYLLLATTYRTPTYQCHRIDQVTYLSGKTGAGKSELTALMLAHFGEFSARDFPANWEDSPTDLEMKAHHAKDSLFVIDDFKPVGGKSGVEKLHAKADRILRGAGNQAGRGRRSATLEARPAYYPRGFIVSTGEDIPRGESLRARMVIAEVKKGDIDFAVITELQQAAANGLLQTAMRGFIQWLAPQIDTLSSHLKTTIADYRQRDNLQFSHRRGVDNFANLMIGLTLFADYALQNGAITPDQHHDLLKNGETHLSKLMDKQGEFLNDCDEVSRFLNLLRTAFNTGRAHISARDNGPPFSATAHYWGWKTIEDNFEGKRLQPQGDRIGWLLDDYICLDPDAAFSTVQRLASDQHQPFEVTQRTLWRRLRDKGLLVVNQENAKNESRHTVKRSIAGKKQNVIQLALAALDESEGSQSSRNETENNAAELSGNFPWESIMEAEPQ